MKREEEKGERRGRKEGEMHAWLQQLGKGYDGTFMHVWGTAPVVV